MTTKEKVIHAVQELPADASFEDAMERLLFLAKIETGLQQAGMPIGGNAAEWGKFTKQETGTILCDSIGLRKRRENDVRFLHAR